MPNFKTQGKLISKDYSYSNFQIDLIRNMLNYFKHRWSFLGVIRFNDFEYDVMCRANVPLCIPWYNMVIKHLSTQSVEYQMS